MTLGVDTGGKPRWHVKFGGIWWYLIARVQGRTLERLEQYADPPGLHLRRSREGQDQQWPAS